MRALLTSAGLEMEEIKEYFVDIILIGSPYLVHSVL